VLKLNMHVAEEAFNPNPFLRPARWVIMSIDKQVGGDGYFEENSVT